MSQSMNLKIKGLHTFVNELSEVPEGALTKADNIVIDADSIAKSRRGYEVYGSFGIDTDRSRQLLSYKNVLLNHFGTKLSYDSAGDGTTWTNYTGNYTAPNNAVKIRGKEVNSNFYFTSNKGVMKLDKINSSPLQSGLPRGLELDLSLNGSSGFLELNHSCAYVVIWGYKDENSNLILGSPSQRTAITNTSGGTRNIILDFSIPAEITTNHFYQVYRTKQLNGTPSEDYYLVYEANPSSAELSAKKITITDILSETLNKGVSAYTSINREGIGRANERPPLCEDIEVFKNMMFYANIKRNHSLALTIVAVNGTNGIASGDVITIDGITYTAHSSEYAPTSISDPNDAKFKLFSTSDTAQDIEDTALSLVRIINRNAKNSSVYAYYMSGVEDLPGQIRLEHRNLDGSSFSVSASAHPQAYNPSLASPASSTNEEKKNGLCWSKLNEPEAVPLSYFQTIGAGDKPILRIIAIRDSLFIFKEDGIWRLSGSSPENIDITLFDSTTKLVAPESAVVLSNQVYMYSDQGIATVSDTGVGVISRPIEGDLIKFLSKDATFFSQVTHAVGYETDRKYIVWTIENTSDSITEQAYVFNTFTNTWTRWTFGCSSAIVNPLDDKIYFASNIDNTIRSERKNFDTRDYADEDYAISITSVTGKTISLASTTNLRAGMFIVQGDLESKIVEVIDSTSVMLLDELSFTNGDAVAYCVITCVITWAPQHGGNPVIKKQFRECHILMTTTRFEKASIGFSTDGSNSTITNQITGQPFTKWGRFAFGRTPWGGQKGRKPLRTLVPFAHQRCRWLNVTFTHESAFEIFEITGMSLFYSSMSEKVTR